MTENSAAHKRARKSWLPIVQSGQASCSEPVCLRPSRWIHPDEPWDLSHDHARGGYLGPSHPGCNRAEGARRGNRARRPRPAPQPAPPQPWFFNSEPL